MATARPRGGEVEMRVTYSHRDGNQPAVFNYSNLGPKWTFDWHSYISDNIVASGSPSNNVRGSCGFSSGPQYPGGGSGVTYMVGSAGSSLFLNFCCRFADLLLDET